MSGYRNEIADFLRSKGLNDYAVAGFLGNFMVESGLNPTSENSGEGAIGFANWEGGRRDALRQWALTHYGAQESDAQSQLTFLWHELTTSYSGVLDQLKHVTSAGEAAAIIDSQYEVSSGDARQDRINYANEFYSGKGPNPPYNGPLAANGSGGTNGGDQMSNDLTRDDYQAVDSLGALLGSVPALKKLVNQALSGGWSIAKFQNQVEDSDWWKNHSETARQVIITQANDPATYKQNLRAAEGQVRTVSEQLGMGLSDDEIQAIAHTSLLTGNTGNDDWIKRAIGHREDYSNIHTTDHLSGEMAANAQQLQQLAGQYGLRWNPADIAHRAKMVATGVTTMDTYRQQATAYAKSAFPSFAKQLDEGQTMMDIASPYIQSASQILELDPAKFDLYSPLIRKGLQGTAAGKPGEPPSSLPIWQFENTLRQDPRWQFTNNAHQEIASTALQIGQAFGFDG